MYFLLLLLAFFRSTYYIYTFKRPRKNTVNSIIPIVLYTLVYFITVERPAYTLQPSELSSLTLIANIVLWLFPSWSRVCLNEVMRNLNNYQSEQHSSVYVPSCCCFSLDWMCSVSGGELQLVQSIGNYPDRNMNELWMRVPNGQSLIPTLSTKWLAHCIIHYLPSQMFYFPQDRLHRVYKSWLSSVLQQPSLKKGSEPF